VVFGTVAFRLDGGDLQVILARLRQAARLRLSGQTLGEAARQHGSGQLLRLQRWDRCQA